MVVKRDGGYHVADDCDSDAAAACAGSRVHDPAAGMGRRRGWARRRKVCGGARGYSCSGRRPRGRRARPQYHFLFQFFIRFRIFRTTLCSHFFSPNLLMGRAALFGGSCTVHWTHARGRADGGPVTCGLWLSESSQRVHSMLTVRH